jgi:hypothetical protein
MFFEIMGMTWFSTDCVKSQLHVEDDRWPPKNTGRNLTAKTVNAGIRFAMQFAAMCEMAMPVAAVA